MSHQEAPGPPLPPGVDHRRLGGVGGPRPGRLRLSLLGARLQTQRERHRHQPPVRRQRAAHLRLPGTHRPTPRPMLPDIQINPHISFI